jgi:DUF917 family protein
LTFSTAWSIGRSIALSRSRKIDPVTTLLKEQNGAHLFRGKIISVTRHVAKGFTRGSVLLCSFSEESGPPSDYDSFSSSTSLAVEFENENLCAVLKQEGEEDKLLAICPDLICFLDLANGAPLGISDYKFGLRVNVVALRAPPIWTTERGLKMGGPSAFGYVPAVVCTTVRNLLIEKQARDGIYSCRHGSIQGPCECLGRVLQGMMGYVVDHRI